LFHFVPIIKSRLAWVRPYLGTELHSGNLLRPR